MSSNQSNPISNSTKPSDDQTWRRVAQQNRLLFDACLRNVRTCGDQGNWDELMRWGAAAAWFASGPGWSGVLSSPELENQLLRAAQQLPRPNVKAASGGKPRWLHVFTEAYATLGHSNLCRRWIQYDPDVVHDVIMLAQVGKAPENLAEVVKHSGGRCVVLDTTTTPWERAAALRKYAWENADVVVLHTHPEEVIATVAFGIAGGPPVLVMNHADHVFWLGCAVGDLVLEIRESGQRWTKNNRGVAASHILPIPLAEQTATLAVGQSKAEARRKLRQTLGLPEDAIILLSVGSAAKYEPMPGLDFVPTVQEILRACPGTYLVAIGPKPEGRWLAAKEATGGRILPLGYQQDAMVFCEAADLYLEGFPMGSLTALLEAGQAGLMCVRAPLDSPLPFCSDSPSLDAIPQPDSLADYVQTAVRLIGDAPARIEGGRKLRESIQSQHCAAGWRARLAEIKMQIPATHQVREEFRSVPATEALCNWYLRSSFRKDPAPAGVEIARRFFVEAWKRTEGQPQLDLQLWQELHRAEQGTDGVKRELSAAEQAQLKQLNRQLYRQGHRQRFLKRADVAAHGDKFGLARKLVYQCLLTTPSCVGDAEWWKQFVKAHLGAGLMAKVRSFRARRQRQLLQAKA